DTRKVEGSIPSRPTTDEPCPLFFRLLPLSEELDPIDIAYVVEAGLYQRLCLLYATRCLAYETFIRVFEESLLSSSCT
ncbi:MAG: hypothetical protein QW220_05375, partial [Candidatus Bathyarchaeia archaeon]